MIKIRKTQPTDIAILMDIFEQAKHIMRKDGNMLQWLSLIHIYRKYIRYVPRLFEHVYTGTRADRKKALEASDISSLVRETEKMCIRDSGLTIQRITRHVTSTQTC